MKKYKYYLFDFDGTLFDTLDSLIEVYRLTFKKFGVAVTHSDCTSFITMNLPMAMKSKNMDMKYEKELIDAFHYFINQPEVVSKTHLYPDTLSLFKYIKDNNIRSSIVTSNSYRHIKDIFNFFELDINIFDFIVGNESFIKPKPDPESILLTLEKMGIKNKDEVLYVGDSIYDLLAASNAGISGILINREIKEKEKISSLLDLFI